MRAIHKYYDWCPISNNRQRYYLKPCIDHIIEPPPTETATMPISAEIARARASNSTNYTPRLVPAYPFSQSLPPGQHISTPPQADHNDTDSSRRPTFLNMTVSARSPPVLNPNTNTKSQRILSTHQLILSTHQLILSTHQVIISTHLLNGPTHHFNASTHLFYDH